ncbi:MAG: hypothetical protein ACPGRW_06280 [Flavobacteriaceae bacterium]
MYWINITTNTNDLLVCLDEASKNTYTDLTTGWVQVPVFDYISKKATWNGSEIVYISRSKKK